MDFKNSQARQGRAFRHQWQMKKFGKICILFRSIQPISLRTLTVTENLSYVGLTKQLDQ